MRFKIAILPLQHHGIPGRTVLMGVDRHYRSIGDIGPSQSQRFLHIQPKRIPVQVPAVGGVTLELNRAVNVDPRHHHDIEPIQHMGHRAGQLTCQCQRPFAARRLIAVQLSVDPHSWLVRIQQILRGAARCRRENQHRNPSPLLRIPKCQDM